ncbi:MAG: TIGR03617 family F420-dependent LLM class oxidoreductase [Actinomycetes bacterium]
MRVDQFLGPRLDGAADRARTIEATGFDGLFTAEAAHGPFLPLALAAEHTRHVTLITNVAVAFARSPLDLAQVANDLQRLSGGRFVLGLGTQIRPHIESRYSMRWSGSPVGQMRDLVEAIRAIQTAWQDRTPLDHRGEHYHHTLMTPMFDPGPNPFGPPPVWLGALGPKMCRLAGEVADGVLVHPFHSGRYVRDVVAPHVEEGRTAAGRTTSFTVHACPIVCTGSTDEERERAEVGVRGLLAFYGSTPAYRVTLDAHGWGDLQPELRALTKAGRWADLPSLLTDEIVEALVVRGEPGQIASRLEERYAGTVDRVGLSLPYEASPATVAEIARGFHPTT